jgi:hypothetical protein
MITATTFLGHIGAAPGDINRFTPPRKLVAYLGLDPRVRQSGNGPGHTGRISKEGASLPRHVLVEAALTAIRSPGPLRAFYQPTETSGDSKWEPLIRADIASSIGGEPAHAERIDGRLGGNVARRLATAVYLFSLTQDVPGVPAPELLASVLVPGAPRRVATCVSACTRGQ